MATKALAAVYRNARATTMLVVLTMTLVLTFGCSEGASGTTGRRIVLGTRIEGAKPEAPFENAAGWRITVRHAYVSVGSLSYFEGAPIVAAAARPASLWRRAWESFIERTAYAHPGHYQTGEARGEMNVPTSVDLAGGPTDISNGAGTTGIVRSATIVFGAPPAGPWASALGEDVIVVEGVAERAAERHFFRMTASSADVQSTTAAPSVVGCAFDETTIDGDGIATLTIDLGVWLESSAFDGLGPSDEAHPIVIEETAAAKKEFIRAVRQASAYRFRFTPAR